MAKRPRPRKRSKKGDVSDKLELATVAELAKHGSEAQSDGDVAVPPASDLIPQDIEASSAETRERPESKGSLGEDEAEESSDNEQKSSKKKRRTRKRRKEPKEGPDPATIQGLGDAAQKAISYAQIYFRDKTSWKFSKPRQNWITRHVLWSEPIFEASKKIADIPQEVFRSLPEDVQNTLTPALQLPEEGAWIPDEHAPVISVYLESMMGLAKQRLLDTLEAASQTSIPNISDQALRTALSPTDKSVAGTESNIDTLQESSENEQDHNGAAESDETNAVQENTPDSASNIDIRALAHAWNELRSTRATTILNWMKTQETKS
ncbi:hypothetical protein MPSI1_001909 [Malassezia psittaci]|uniref:WKF domain-containing protein n=1 Tax=Malassezia psittaci TaxID=1821823 RepID=A0AAF0F9B7_9BASI|nr:hypothetical protein MPSI1_001909 [Malassezia psittaci]